MKIQMYSLILILILIFFSGCTQPDDNFTPKRYNSEKIVQLQKSITDYSVTVEEKLQNDGPTITRYLLIKRPYMYRVVDSKDCYSLSNGNIRWIYCNGSDAATYFEDPSVRRFFDDLDYQQIFTNMLSESPGIMKGNDTIDGTSTWIIETMPVPKRYNIRYSFTTVRLWADIKTGMILRAELIPNNTTNVGIIQFHNVTVNRGISDDHFTFTPGPEIKIINQKAGRFTENLEGKAGYADAAIPCTDCPLPINTLPS